MLRVGDVLEGASPPYPIEPSSPVGLSYVVWRRPLYAGGLGCEVYAVRVLPASPGLRVLGLLLRWLL
jgi:hypothetical protein